MNAQWQSASAFTKAAARNCQHPYLYKIAYLKIINDEAFGMFYALNV